MVYNGVRLELCEDTCVESGDDVMPRNSRSSQFAVLMTSEGGGSTHEIAVSLHVVSLEVLSLQSRSLDSKHRHARFSLVWTHIDEPFDPLLDDRGRGCEPGHQLSHNL